MLIKKMIVFCVKFYLRLFPLKFGRRFLIERAQKFIPIGENKLSLVINGQMVDFILQIPEDNYYTDLYFTNQLEEGTSLFFSSFLKESDIIFDIGANLGFMSLQFACLSSKGLVYSFEPMPITFSKLSSNIKLNPNLSNRINIVKKAVSDFDGPLNLFVPNDGHHGLVSISSKVSQDVNSIQVQACTIDSFVSENNIKIIDFIKVDVEGAEAMVIKGAINSIAKFKPSIMLEANIGIHLDRNNLIDLIDHLCSFDNYHLFRAPSAYKTVVKMKDSTDFEDGDNIFILNENHFNRL